MSEKYKDTPINKSLWMDCLFDQLQECKMKGESNVYFSDVDKRVVEISKVIVEYKIPAEDKEELENE